MAGAKRGRRRSRGSIERQPNGALKVSVYAGYDPITGKRHYLRETVPAGPQAQAQAEKSRIRLLSQVDERRHPKTSATVNQLLDRYLDVLDVDFNTRRTYENYIRNHIRPVLGRLPLSRVDGEVLDSFYGVLRRCRRRCGGEKGLIDHRVEQEHECDARCQAHRCRPLSASSVRQIHWILSGAFDRAVKWDWLSVTPSNSASPPSPPRPNPTPPSADEAARILNAAWSDPDWGTFVWMAMTTGARRGELCALKRQHLDRDSLVLTIPQSVSGSRLFLREKDTKTHQQRRVALGQETAALLDELLARQDIRATTLGVKLDGKAYLFSRAPDCSEPYLPDGVTQRYSRLAARLGIDTTLHKLRHYNATELIAAGVDLRTVAGRLGHGSGGVTTLRTYAAWLDDSGRAAASHLESKLPSPPRNSTISK